MKIIHKVICLISFTFIIPLSLCAAEQNSTAVVISEIAEENLVPFKHEIVDLGQEKYRLGAINIDKNQRSFVVSGRLLRKELPVEFIAVTQGGHKAYESLLELETDAYIFNLACIFIGLDEYPGKPPQYHFDPTPIAGSAVEIWISWVANGVKQQIEAADLFQYDNKRLVRGGWVYTGSFFTSDGKYMAAIDGVLVGFIHDPSSILEHRTGFGGGSFQDLRLDEELLPAVETPIEVLFKFSRVIAE